MQWACHRRETSRNKLKAVAEGMIHAEYAGKVRQLGAMLIVLPPSRASPLPPLECVRLDTLGTCESRACPRRGLFEQHKNQLGRVRCWLCCRLRGQARCHILKCARPNNAYTCGSEPAREQARPYNAKPTCKARINPLFTLSLCPATPLALVPLQPPSRQSLHTRQYAVTRRFSMSVLDGVSLLLAVGLFIYLLVALLRADRN